MIKLNSKTGNDTAAPGIQKIYFGCHPDDFDLYFDPVCADIFKYVDCTFLYKEDPAAKWEPGEMEEDLKSMQLFVIPVTWKFLEQENEARCTELPFALEHHIPVLPLLEEHGLEMEFQKVCGPIQCIDRLAENEDSDAVPYDQKIGRFFAEVMLDDVWEKKAEDEFSAVLHLCFLEPDRRYAQELAHLIHQTDRGQDLAIRYDKMTQPEENSTDQVREAMDECDALVFVVTPHILEPGNFLLTTEYPAARESGKPILFARMADTDEARLSEAFPEGPKPVDARDGSSLSDALESLGKELAVSEEKDPEHLFIIGLGYLSGVSGETDPEKAVSIFTEAAEQGSVHAQYILGVCYSYGQGVAREDAKAIQYFTMAADQGYSSAQYDLAICLEEGRGGDRNPRKAFKLYKQVAEQGNRYAETALARCYYKGFGVLRSYSRAAIWYSEAADQDEPAAQYNLGLCYMAGSGVAEDLEEAASWFEKAAEQDFVPAEYNLGICYMFGQGVSEDHAKAIEWLTKAANAGHAAAQCYLGRCYDNGKGAARDVRLAYEWYKKAARQEEPHAEDEIGLFYENGKLEHQDDEKVEQWNKKLAVWEEELADQESEDNEQC